MKPLFSISGVGVLNSLKTENTLFAFDFDGTLAPLVSNPHAARMSARTRQLLRRLSEQAKVAVVSGRSKKDLAKRVRLPKVLLIGNHGLEYAGFRQKAELSKARSLTLKWARALRRAGFPAGVVVEPKTYSLSIHFRHSPHPHRAGHLIRTFCRSLKPTPKIIMGKYVVNLVSPTAPHKGQAVTALAKELRRRRILFVGDDLTDENAFGMTKVLGVRISKTAHSRAKYYLRQQKDINKLLVFLL